MRVTKIVGGTKNVVLVLHIFLGCVHTLFTRIYFLYSHTCNALGRNFLSISFKMNIFGLT